MKEAPRLMEEAELGGWQEVVVRMGLDLGAADSWRP